MRKRVHWKDGLLILAVSFLAAGGLCAAEPAGGSDLEALKKLERMMGLGRKIVAENQDLINDPTKGDKG